MSARGRPFKACRRCRALVDKNTEICPVCGSKDFTDEWEGVIIIVDPGRSVLAQELKIGSQGRFAIKVV
ncbi:transcription elongation factor subunit Spt4 [Thermogladius sp. 4427co]|uniref:transcription elongation factor subunit Spt4 n=1 Tax=Thermogladius sp. 4427co TaxID=3450718 RepID=UPI003F79080E